MTLTDPAPRARHALPRATQIGYALGAVGTGAYGTAPSLLLLFFMTDTLGIPPAPAGLGLFAVKTWDVMIDPVLGIISDRTRTRWGRRRPFLLVGAVLLGISLSLLFAVPDLATVGARFTWVLVMFFICSTAFSVFSVPYIAMPAEMTDDYHERTTLMSFRMAFMSAGVLVAGGVAPLIRDVAGGGRGGYAAMSVALGVICGTFMLMAFLATRRVPFTEHVQAGMSVREQLRLAAGNRPFIVLFVTFLLQMTAVGSLVATLPYFVAYILERSGVVFTMGFVVLTVASILAMPAWVGRSRRVGKARGYALSLIVFAAMSTALLPLGAHSPLTLFYALVTVMGIGFAGTQLFPFSMLPDAIQHDTERSGLRREGAFAGVWISAEGIGMALGGLIAGTVLGWSGFIESTTGGVAQPGSALLGIRVAFAVVPACLLMLGLVVLRAGTGEGRRWATGASTPGPAR